MAVHGGGGRRGGGGRPRRAGWNRASQWRWPAAPPKAEAGAVRMWRWWR
ncbi:hypothetical protein ACP4OV_028057 [Aristida adscensionis]